MKKNLFVCIALAMLLTGCNSAYKFATSNRAGLGHGVCYIPTLANLQVTPTHVTASMTAAEMKGLSEEKCKQTVVAKALETQNADVMVSPYFYYERGEDGKVANLIVIGYPATITSFRSLTSKDIPAENKSTDEELKWKSVNGEAAVNSLTIAEVQIDPKKQLTMNSAELVGMNEEKALAKAKETMLIQENADFLYEVQYKITSSESGLSMLTMTAFPARYHKYRATTTNEVLSLRPGKKPVVMFSTIIADVKQTGERIKKSYRVACHSKEEAKEMARYTALQKYNADFLLNETFYYEYDSSNKMITRVIICGTPAIYSNFRIWKPGDVLELPSTGQEESSAKSIFGGFLDIFKK
jgi:hypothetical protein